MAEDRQVFAAKTVAQRAGGVAAFQAALAGVLATAFVFGVSNPFGVDAGSYLDAAVLAVVAYFLYYKSSRVAAVVALIYYVVSIIISVGDGTIQHPSFVGVIFALAYLNAVRATFAMRRLQGAELNALTVYGN